MVWRKVFGKPSETDDTGPATTPAPAERALPPHLAQAIARRTGTASPPDDPAQRRILAVRRQRQAILYDIEQGEMAAAPDNPWTGRIALLSDALGTVTADIAQASIVEPGPSHPLPPTPVSIVDVTAGDVASVAFRVGEHRFTYSDDQDWAERGHQVIRTELVRRTGDPVALVPGDTPATLRADLAAHIDDTLFVFASDLRDRVLDGEPLPSNVTLADLAPPCPVCGGWTDWRGTCQACARRNARIAALKQEERRLLDDRIREDEERHRLVEGLPLARKRLRDVEAELARLGDAPA
jgi:hypothetical protein